MGEHQDLALVDDRALRARVKLLGRLLGRVLRAQALPGVYDAVELLRKGFIAQRRQFDERRHEQLMQAIDGLSADVLADRKSTRLNSSHVAISYAVFCLKRKKW